MDIGAVGSDENKNALLCGSDFNNNHGESQSNIPTFSLNLQSTTNSNTNANRTGSSSNVSTSGSSANIGGIVSNTDDFLNVTNLPMKDSVTPGDFVGEFESVSDNVKVEHGLSTATPTQFSGDLDVQTRKVPALSYISSFIQDHVNSNPPPVISNTPCKTYQFANSTLLRVDLQDSQGNVVRSLEPATLPLSQCGSVLVRTLKLTGNDMKYLAKGVKMSSEVNNNVSISSMPKSSKKNEFNAKGHAGTSRSGRVGNNSSSKPKPQSQNSCNNNNNNFNNNNGNNTNTNEYNHVLGRTYTNEEKALLKQTIAPFTFPLFGTSPHLNNKTKFTLQDWNINEIDLMVKRGYLENIAIRQYIKFYPNVRPNLWIILQICKKSLPKDCDFRWRSPISRLKKHYDALKQHLLLQGTPVVRNYLIPKNYLIDDQLLSACINFSDLKQRFNLWQLNDNKNNNNGGNIAKSRRLNLSSQASSKNNTLNLSSYVL